MLAADMKYCPACDVAQATGSRCWSCGSRELTTKKPEHWPNGFPIPAGSQTVVFTEPKRGTAFVEGDELPERHSMDAIVGNVK